MAYVYRHIRLDKNVPFYIGIGEIDRRSRVNYGRNRLWNYIAAKTPYEVEILVDKIEWDEACKKEVEFINLYGRIDKNTGTLANMTDGGEGRPTHNFCKYPLFNTWCNIKKICYTKTNPKYKTHGAKGIKMCDKWLDDFLEFNKWCIINGWEDGKFVARRDRSKGFDENNCIVLNNRRELASMNCSTSVFINYNNENISIPDASRKYNIPKALLYTRIRKGWDIKRAIETSTNKSKRNNNIKTPNNYEYRSSK